MASPQTPKLITPDDKNASDASDTPSSAAPAPTLAPPASGATKKKLTRILSVQSSFDYQQRPHPITKRFSIDADPSSVVSASPITDLSNNPLQRSTRLETNEIPPRLSPIASLNKEPHAVRSPTLKKNDSFLEIPYEKGEIVDLIKLADDPNAATHLTNDGHEVLLEHGAAP